MYILCPRLPGESWFCGAVYVTVTYCYSLQEYAQSSSFHNVFSNDTKTDANVIFRRMNSIESFPPSSSISLASVTLDAVASLGYHSSLPTFLFFLHLMGVTLASTLVFLLFLLPPNYLMTEKQAWCDWISRPDLHFKSTIIKWSIPCQ